MHVLSLSLASHTPPAPPLTPQPRHSIIKRPMDLATVMKKLRGGDYPTLKELREEVELVFVNARLYNPSHHAVHHVRHPTTYLLDRFFRRGRPARQTSWYAVSDTHARIPHPITTPQLAIVLLGIFRHELAGIVAKCLGRPPPPPPTRSATSPPPPAASAVDTVSRPFIHPASQPASQRGRRTYSTTLPHPPISRDNRAPTRRRWPWHSSWRRPFPRRRTRRCWRRSPWARLSRPWRPRWAPAFPPRARRSSSRRPRRRRPRPRRRRWQQQRLRLRRRCRPRGRRRRTVPVPQPPQHGRP